MARRPKTLLDRLTRKGPLARSRRFFLRELWMIEVDRLAWPMAFLVRALRVVAIAVRGTIRDDLKQHAQSLTYITVFSMIPLLAFSFGIAKAFGFYNAEAREGFNEVIDEVAGASPDTSLELEGLETPSTPAAELNPLEQGFGVWANEVLDEHERAIAAGGFAASATESPFRQGLNWLLRLADNTDLKALSALAILFLFYSVVRMLGALEASLNDIWGIQRQRTLLRKITDYLTIMVVAPVIVIGGTVWIKSWDFGLDTEYLPKNNNILLILTTGLGFAFALFTFPNGPVKIVSALLGGLVAALGWHAALELIARGSIGLGKAEPLYAAFAAVPMLLLFFYLSWLILLFGGEVAYAHQTEPVFTSIARTGAVDQAWRESLAPRLAGRIAHSFLQGIPAPTAAELAADLGVPPRHVRGVLDELVQRELLVRTSGDEDEETFLPARDPSGIRLLDLFEALRHDGEVNVLPTPTKLDRRVDTLMARMRVEAKASDSNLDLVELAGLLEEEPFGTVNELPRVAD